MALETSTVRGADGALHEVLLDTITGTVYEIPAMKLSIGDEGSNDGFVSSANPLPVSLAGVPLPSGAATETTLAAVLAKIIAAPATEAKQDSVLTKLAAGLPAALGAGGGLKIDGSGTVLPVAQTTADAANTVRSTSTLVIPVQIVDSAGRSPKTDSATTAQMVIDYAHHEVHSGSHFFVRGYQDLAINNVLDFTFTTPDSAKWMHWLWDIQTESETNWLIYEGAVATNPLANAVTPLNSNRNSSTASGAALRYELQANLAAANGDTSVAAATLISSGISGAGKGGSGVARRDSEIILKQNTVYCMRAIATAAGYINFDMQWYEHTNG